MTEVVKFVSKAERERDRLIREARALYDSIYGIHNWPQPTEKKE